MRLSRGVADLPSLRVWCQDRMARLLRSHGPTSIHQDVQNIIRGPSITTTSYTHMYDSGRHFRTWRTDHMKKTTTNSSIFMLSYDGDDETPYCGTILDVLEVDYGSFNTVVLEVKWYKSIMAPPNRATMVKDECGFYRVDTTRTSSAGTEFSDTIVFPSQVDQCFLIPMETHTHWSIVVPIFPRRRQVNIRAPVDEDSD